MSGQYDVVVVGGGVVGLVAALGLAIQTDLKIAMIDSQPFPATWKKDDLDYRVSAISLASQRIFQNLSVWEKIQAKRCSAYERMSVWDNSSRIDFNATALQSPALGFIVEDTVIRASLMEVLQQLKRVEFLPSVKLTSLQMTDIAVQLITAQQQILSTQLVIGADGAQSWVRSQAGIECHEMDYDHTAIVAKVMTSESHQKTAWQRFVKNGPIAFLPLADEKNSSIVWSTLPQEAEQLMNEAPDHFKKSLAATFGNQLGKILEVDTRYHYRLKMRHAKHYVSSRIALIGDAAHTLHPLAGQGVNLGLLDAACLVNVIKDALHQNRNFAALHTLRKYERWRKGDNLAMLKMVELLKYLFTSEKIWIQSLRAFGLNFTDRVSFLKNFFANHAVGRSGDLPELAQ